MLPLLTFASGLLAGIVGIRLVRNASLPEKGKAAAGTIGEKARHGLDQAQTSLRQASISSLTAIEKTSAALRSKLEQEEAATAASPDEIVTSAEAEVVAAENPVVKAAPKPRAPRKPARSKAKPKPTPVGGGEPE